MRFFSLHKKILFVILILTSVPLILLTLYSAKNLSETEQYLRKNTTAALDKQAEDALVIRAKGVATAIEQLLNRIEGDLRTFALLPLSKKNIQQFYLTHQKHIPDTDNPSIPLYSEIAIISPDGWEQFRFSDGQFSDQLRYVADPENTTYRTEDYVEQVLNLKGDDIHVSHLTGFHANKSQNTYTGVIRFAMPVKDAQDNILRIIMLSLDHRHLTAFTNHISPTSTGFVMTPSYESGNYAFMFDHEGWAITHPKHWDIRGLDATGNSVPAYSSSSPQSDIEAGNIPFNLLQAEFIHPNYPVVAKQVLAGKPGVVDVTNIGGSKKIMAYAPIHYDSGIYKKSGIFGGVTIGADVVQFHQPALNIAAVIQQELSQFSIQSWALVLFTIIVVIVVGMQLSRSITTPLNTLSQKTVEMADDDFSATVNIHSNDEVGVLATSFNRMVVELASKRQKLMNTIEALNRSHTEVLNEKNFKQTLLENIEIGILTIDANNIITSVNSTAQQLFQIDSPDITLDSALKTWPKLHAMITDHLDHTPISRCNNEIVCNRNQQEQTYHVNILPQHTETADIIITIEDITDQVTIRTDMERMKRLAAMGRLSAGLAHEIRNPLTGISIMLDDLHDRLLGQSNDQLLIQKSLQEIDRLEKLVNELLDFATTNSTLSPGHIHTLIDDSLIFIKKQCERNRIQLISDISEVPEIMLDASKVKQALLNLYTNAIDAMPDGGTLKVTLSSEESSAVIQIEDTGHGIPDENKQTIFEPFYTTKGKGAGLGLAITHNIIREHGGTIDIFSGADSGSIFTIHFPFITF